MVAIGDELEFYGILASGQSISNTTSTANTITLLLLVLLLLLLVVGMAQDLSFLGKNHPFARYFSARQGNRVLSQIIQENLFLRS